MPLTLLVSLFLLAAGGTRADADALFKAGRYHEAGDIYLQLLHQSPRDLSLLDAMGQTLLRAGEPRLAAGFFQQELKIDPANRIAARSLATTLTDLGASEEARGLLTRLTQTDSTDGESWFMLGMVSYKTGYYPAAIQQLDRALSLKPEPSRRNRAEITRSLSLLEVGKNADAAKEISRLLAIPENSRDLDLLLGYTRSLYEAGNYSEASTQAQRAATADPKNAAAHFWLARILQQQDRLPQAITEAESARELNPDSPAPRNLLVRLYTKSGRQADADKESEWLRVREAASPK